MTRSNNYIYILICTIIAACMQYYFISLNLGDHEQYIDNIDAFSTWAEVGTSEKSWFYIFIFLISGFLNFSPVNILVFLAIAAYAGTLFVSIRNGNQRISTSTYLSQFYTFNVTNLYYFFLSNYRSGVVRCMLCLA